MSYASNHPVKCAGPACTAQHPNRWLDQVRMARRGWYHGSDGKAYCPKHVPKWVKTYRTG